jgi:hypothetical protein
MNVAVQIGAGQIAVLFVLASVAFAMLFLQQNKIEGQGKRILRLLEGGIGHNPPVRIVLALPTITRNGVPMPNLELLNDTVATIPIQTQDSAGVVVPPKAGDTFTAVSSLPASLGVAVTPDASGNPTLVLTPLVQASPGISVVISDADGLPQITQLVDIVPDLTPTNIVLNVAGETTTPQAVPPNPGP